MPTKPEVLASRTVAESRLFEIQEVDLRFANGAEVRFEKLVNRGYGAVLVVPVTAEGTVLMVREYGAGVDRYELQLPKGRMEAGEDMLSSADRELREETGRAAGSLEFVRGVTVAPGYLGHVTNIVLARDLHPAPLPGDEPEPPEVIEWRLDALDALLERDDCTEARTIAALYMVRDRLAAEERQ
jgi:ADP-ribose diphosphatase